MVHAEAFTQRSLSTRLDCSLGSINQSLKELKKVGFLSKDYCITPKGRDLIKARSPRRAIILAAGFGMRMAPINTETPKPLLCIHDETIIERQIKFLHEAGINEIYVVVGFMKETFEYLIDDYGVKLIVNTEYSTKNNLHSLHLAKEHLNNCYIIPGDIWLEENPFNSIELYSWYLVSERKSDKAEFRINRKEELVRVKKGESGNVSIGIAYITEDAEDKVLANLEQYATNSKYDNSFWETCLENKERLIVYAKTAKKGNAVEINTYEQLRGFDPNSTHLESEAIQAIEKALNVTNQDIVDIKVLKKGMTNRSFMFSCKGKRYIMRIPGEGTDMLINRHEEGQVYNAIKDRGICDNLTYFDPENGYKITEYFEGSRNCDPASIEDVCRCMKRLRAFHQFKLKVNHTFDIYRQIEFYESLWNGAKSVYRDYEKTKAGVYELKTYIDAHAKDYSLTHIDAVCDNFLFVNINGKEEIRLIDWEYAGMQDTDVDIAMNCIYAMYDRDWVEKVIDAYYPEGCIKETRIKIYCYIAACGLLWSNWCEYKRLLGVDFGEYSIRQYRYAKEYYRIVMEELGNVEGR